MDGQSLMKSTWLKLFSVLLLVLMVSPLVLPVVKAAPVDEFMTPFNTALSMIVEVFKLTWLGDAGVDTYAAIVRFSIWLVMFTIINEILTKFDYFSNKSAKIIALAFSVMAAIFMPQTMLIVIGESYAALFSMIFIGAIVFAGWKLGNWVEKEGGPGSKWMFIIIMLVLMWFVWLIQTTLAAERNVPEMDWWIFGTIYNWFGTVALIALGWLLVTKGFMGGGTAPGPGPGLGAGDTGDTSKTTEKAAEDEQEAAVGADEVRKAAKTGEELARIEGRLEGMKGQMETNALQVLNELGNLLDALQAAAKEVETVGDQQTQERYNQLLNTIMAKVEELVRFLAEEGKIERREDENLRQQIKLVRIEKTKLRKSVFTPLGAAKHRMQKAWDMWEKNKKESTGQFRAVQGNRGIFDKYMAELDTLKKDADRILNKCRQIERVEDRLVRRQRREVGREVKKLKDLHGALSSLSAKADSEEIGKLRNELSGIAAKINERAQSYKLGAGAGEVRGSAATVLGIQKQIEAITTEVERITRELLDISKAQEAQQQQQQPAP